MGVEEAAVYADAVLLHASPGGGFGEHGRDVVLELFVEAGGLGGLGVGVFDGPAGDIVGAAFDPPAIEDTERRDAVEGGLHAGGAGGFIGAARGVDPDVDALGEFGAESPVVVFEVDDLERAGVELGCGGEDVADEALAGDIGRMSLAGEENLEAADLFGDGDEPGGIGEEQAGAFVGRDAASEAEGEDGGVELLAGALGDGAQEAQFALEVSVGDERRGDAVDGAEVLVVGAPVGDLGVEELLKGAESQVAAWTPLVMEWTL